MSPGVTAHALASVPQASVYCVAAVLWTAAKFSVPREHKLALPRRLKALLLHMARRSAQERPSAAEAIKVTGTGWWPQGRQLHGASRAQEKGPGAAWGLCCPPAGHVPSGRACPSAPVAVAGPGGTLCPRCWAPPRAGHGRHPCLQVCGSYLLQRGMDSRKILAHLRASTCKVRWAPGHRCGPRPRPGTPGR